MIIDQSTVLRGTVFRKRLWGKEAFLIGRMAGPASPCPRRFLADVVDRRRPEIGNPVKVVHKNPRRGESISDGGRQPQGHQSVFVLRIPAEKKSLG